MRYLSETIIKMLSLDNCKYTIFGNSLISSDASDEHDASASIVNKAPRQFRQCAVRGLCTHIHMITSIYIYRYYTYIDI